MEHGSTFCLMRTQIHASCRIARRAAYQSSAAECASRATSAAVPSPPRTSTPSISMQHLLLTAHKDSQQNCATSSAAVNVVLGRHHRRAIPRHHERGTGVVRRHEDMGRLILHAVPVLEEPGAGTFLRGHHHGVIVVAVMVASRRAITHHL